MEELQAKHELNKELLKWHIAKHKETIAILAEAMDMSRASLNAKINGRTSITLGELQFLVKRYSLTDKEIFDLFFSDL